MGKNIEAPSGGGPKPGPLDPDFSVARSRTDRGVICPLSVASCLHDQSQPTTNHGRLSTGCCLNPIQVDLFSIPQFFPEFWLLWERLFSRRSQRLLWQSRLRRDSTVKLASHIWATTRQCLTLGRGKRLLPPRSLFFCGSSFSPLHP